MSYSYVRCLDDYVTHFASADETATRRLGSSLMYKKYDELFHRPRVCFVESSRPADAAVVAAPI